MGLEIVSRPPRRAAPPIPTGEVILEPPPEVPAASAKGWGRMLSIMPMAAGAAAMGLMMGAQRGGPLAYVAGGMYGISTLGMIAMQVAGQVGGQSKRDMIDARRQYMRRLSQVRAQVRTTIRRQREAINYRHPDPEALWSTAASNRLWERRRADADFGVVRIGLGPQEIATALVPPQTRAVDELEPLCAVALRQFVATYSIVPDLPVAIALRDFSHVYLRGDGEAVAALVRATLAQLSTFHAPDDLLIGLCVSDVARPRWEWAKWLPHAVHPGKTDAAGQVRLFASSVTSLEAMLDDVLAGRGRFDGAPSSATGPHLVVLVDGGSTAGSDHLMTEGGVEGVTLIDVSTPPPRLLDEASVVLDIAADGTVSGSTMDGTTQVGLADALPVEQAEALARALAPKRLSATSYAEAAPTRDMGLAELLGIEDPFALDLEHGWASRPNRDRLRVPIGLGSDGRPIELDLKESAQDGMGPHGLLVGATGSGKSELLRTLVLALAVTHSPEILNFVLVDFKGGATFVALDRLPHTSAVITNLEEELALVDRMLGAIAGELTRRQELLRYAGNYQSQRDYERARAAGVPLAPLPSLLIIVDEFSELLSARPDFIEMFVQIGRVGRSLGVHLLLASQRLEEGRLRGLETHLSYRIALRTFSSMDSRAVIGSPDAYELPKAAGHGLVKTGVDSMVRFRAAYVSGVIRRGEDGVRLDHRRAADLVHPFTTHYQAVPTPEAPEREPVEVPETAVGDTLLDVLVRGMEGRGLPAHQVWLPPLAEPATLDQLLPAATHTSQRGFGVNDPAVAGSLRGVVGIIDKPFEQRREPMWLDLSGASGNAVVVGGPQSGKTTFLRTLVASLALSHTPAEAQFFCLDFGGGGLTALRDLPHVSSVAGRGDVNRVRRTIAEINGLMLEREQRLAAAGVDIATYRRMKRSGQVPDDPFGDVFLVVDGWATIRGDFEDLEPVLADIANRGLGFGVHILASGVRWMEIRPAQRDTFGIKVELRLGDPGDSLINRRAAVNVPEQSPGHGLTPDGLHFLTGLPRIDGTRRVDDLADAVTSLVKYVRGGWMLPPARALRLLPDELPYAALPAPDPDRPGRLPIGIAESDLQPVHLDFGAEAHTLVFGDVECGKSSFLRGLARGITDGYRSDQAKIILVDYRRSLLGCVQTEHLIGYGTSPQVTANLIADAAVVMKERLPGADVTAQQLRDRSWWSGPELFVLVDDYDLVAAGATNPLAPLLEFLAQGRDVGLHLVIARRAGGASRALFDPIIARIRELSSPGIMMSGPKEEGPLIPDVKPQPLPPGRGRLFTRREGVRLIQTAWTPPA
ncbi:MAG TPA: type VII secretion protein EccCa [Micromonosporaceae bacterium]|nr:type VII secretion protein EccCa [Micromonosporaceae bacterium]